MATSIEIKSSRLQFQQTISRPYIIVPCSFSLVYSASLAFEKMHHMRVGDLCESTEVGGTLLLLSISLWCSRTLSITFLNCWGYASPFQFLCLFFRIFWHLQFSNIAVTITRAIALYVARLESLRLVKEQTASSINPLRHALVCFSVVAVKSIQTASAVCSFDTPKISTLALFLTTMWLLSVLLIACKHELQVIHMAANISDRPVCKMISMLTNL